MNLVLRDGLVRRARGLAVVGLGLVTGCVAPRYSTEQGAATLSVPAPIAEGSDQGNAVGPRSGAVPPAGAASGSAAPPATASPAEPPVPADLVPSNLPDPEPLRVSEQLEYELEYREGTVSVLSLTKKNSKTPLVTARKMGRFAIELRIGRELIDRVRFDFPTLAADDPSTKPANALDVPLSLSARAVVRTRVLVPDSPRTRRMLLVDRALTKATPLPLPGDPAASSPPAAPSAPATPHGRSDPSGVVAPVAPLSASPTPTSPSSAPLPGTSVNPHPVPKPTSLSSTKPE